MLCAKAFAQINRAPYGLDEQHPVQHTAALQASTCASLVTEQYLWIASAMVTKYTYSAAPQAPSTTELATSLSLQQIGQCKMSRDMQACRRCRTGMLGPPGGVQYKLVLLRWSGRLRLHDCCAHLMWMACFALLDWQGLPRGKLFQIVIENEQGFSKPLSAAPLNRCSAFYESACPLTVETPADGRSPLRDWRPKPAGKHTAASLRSSR